MSSISQQIRDQFESAKSIAVVSHIRPDGDAVGSVLGLGTALAATGKEVQFVLEDGGSATFKDLENYKRITTEVKPPVDLVVVVDCSDLERTGKALNGLDVDINIDHHPTNLNFAKINFVQSDSAATSQILTENLAEWGLPLNESIAESLLAGILTDTIGFRTSNTTAATLRAASQLIDTGVNMPAIYNKVLLERSFEAVQLWGRGIYNLQRQGRIAWTTLDKEDRRLSSYFGKDDAELTGLLSTIKDVDIIMVFISQDNGHVKVSWRARPGYDVSKTALYFGGGGHAPAAGATIEGSLTEVIERVLEQTQKVLQ